MKCSVFYLMPQVYREEGVSLFFHLGRLLCGYKILSAKIIFHTSQEIKARGLISNLSLGARGGRRFHKIHIYLLGGLALLSSFFTQGFNLNFFSSSHKIKLFAYGPFP